MDRFKSILILFILVLPWINGFGQVSGFVGQIGTNQKNYEKVIASHHKQLLEVCDNNLDSAYQLWVDVMYDLEKFAESSNVDIKGLKLWIHIFVKDGKIKELYYHPKPNSRNTDFSKVTVLLEKFINTYNFPIKSKTKFNHYGSASFPVFYIKNVQEEK
jgi:hypothetical protein